MTEYEAKFLNINREEIMEKLIEIGAKIKHDDTKYYRSVYFMAKPGIKGYCRVRCEIDKVFLTAKTYTLNPDFPQEFELQLHDDDSSSAFEKANMFLKAIGLEQKSYHESRRTLFSHHHAHEITLDTLPGLPTFMEIDCTSKENLDELIKMLQLPTENMRYGAYDRTYNEYYGIDLKVINDETPSLTFANILNEIKPLKNKEMLERIADAQKFL